MNNKITIYTYIHKLNKIINLKLILFFLYKKKKIK